MWCVLDINECERNTSNCHASALCSNTDGGFICVCRLGYVGNGTYCEGRNLFIHFISTKVKQLLSLHKYT